MTETPPSFDRFSHNDAWQLGSQLVTTAQNQHLPVTIAPWLGDQRVFHAAMPGTSADNDAWVEKKARVVRRFGRSSLDVFEHYKIADNPGFLDAFGLPRDQYAPGEGAIPILVNGSIVGVLAISGLEEGGDHQLAEDALLYHQAQASSNTTGTSS
jgi:uncharacterized protein (UPF0303 family)